MDVIADADLKKRFPPQIVAEMEEIANAPRIQSAGYVQRCHFCGGLASRGSDVQGRWRGECCGG